MHVTNRTFSVINGRKLSGVSFGFEDGGGVHHFNVKFLVFAKRTQDEMLASWSIDETTISESAGRERARDCERLEKSWVVEGPMTALPVNQAIQGFQGDGVTDLIVSGVQEVCCGMKTFIVFLGGLLADVVGRAELYVGLFEVGSNAENR